MKVEIKVQTDITEPYAVIYTGQITEEIHKIMETIGNANGVIPAVCNDKTIILSTDDIYLIRVEDDKANLYCRDKKYICKKRLFELEKILRYDFMRISKTTLVNLKYIAGVESSFNGMMLLTMKNGCKDYMSRKYLPGFKKYLGM